MENDCIETHLYVMTKLIFYGVGRISTCTFEIFIYFLLWVFNPDPSKIFDDLVE